MGVYVLLRERVASGVLCSVGLVVLVEVSNVAVGFERNVIECQIKLAFYWFVSPSTASSFWSGHPTLFVLIVLYICIVVH